MSQKNKISQTIISPTILPVNKPSKSLVISEDEKKLAKALAKYLIKNHNGKENAINYNDIANAILHLTKRDKKLAGFSKERISESTLRKYIYFIRHEGLVKYLLANSHGYYVSNDTEQIQKYLESLENRIQEIQDIKTAILVQFNKDNKKDS